MKRQGLRAARWAVLPLAILLGACLGRDETTTYMETFAGADIGVPVVERFGVEPLEMRLHDSTFLELDVADTAAQLRPAADAHALTLGIARLLQASRREGAYVDSIRVSLVWRDTTGVSYRTYTFRSTYRAAELRAQDSP